MLVVVSWDYKVPSMVWLNAVWNAAAHAWSLQEQLDLNLGRLIYLIREVRVWRTLSRTWTVWGLSTMYLHLGARASCELIVCIVPLAEFVRRQYLSGKEYLRLLGWIELLTSGAIVAWVNRTADYVRFARSWVCVWVANWITDGLVNFDGLLALGTFVLLVLNLRLFHIQFEPRILNNVRI